MAAKEFTLAFMIAGKLSGAFTNTFKKANSTVESFNQKIATLNTQASRTDDLVKLRGETKEASAAFFDAKRRLALLSEAMRQTGEKSSYVAAEFKKAKLAVEKTKASLDRKLTALRELNSAMGATGVSTSTLVARQKELALAADRARVAQERLKRANELQEKWSSRAASSKSALLALTATGATLGLPIREAMKMEDAMADIAKVANFDTPDGLKNLQKELQKMSLRIPLTADGLAQIAAAAAQSGIASKELSAFTEQAAKMAVAFDITANDAGTMMAKWKSGMGLTNEETYRLADAVNYLSNNNAALASEIGDTIKRYGALGKVAGLTAEQTAALSASVIGAGATSETAATGIKAMMRAMGSGGSMSGVQAAAFKNVGIDPKQLQKNLQKDAPQAIMNTLEAIQKKIPKEKWNQYLNAMFGDEAAVAIGPMMQNLYALKVNFERVSDPAKYAGSMLGEFQSRAATTSNALTLASNTVKYFARAVGAPLLDPLKEGSTEFVKWGEKIGDWVSNNKELVLGAVQAAGAVLSLVVGYHALRIAIGFAVSPMLGLLTSFKKITEAVTVARNSTMLASAATKTWAGVCKVASFAGSVFKASLRGVGIALKFMFTNPIGLAITAISGLVAAGFVLYKNWDSVKAKLSELSASFSEKFQGISTVLSAWWGNAKSIFENMECWFMNLVGFVRNNFTGEWSAAWESVKGIFSNVFESLKSIAKAPINWIIEKVNSLIGDVNSIGSMNIPGLGNIGVNIPTIPKLAEGGIATRSMLANIGEGGEPEAIIPLSKLPKLLGATGGGISVNFAPVINVSGGSVDAYEGVKRGLDEGRRQFEKDFRRLMADQQRLSFE